MMILNCDKNLCEENLLVTINMNIATRGKEGQMMPGPTEGPTDKGLARPALWVEQIEGKCL